VIGLQPGDNLQVYISGTGTLYTTVGGELLGVGGGPATPQVLASTTISTANAWNSIYAGPPANIQALVNYISLLNLGGTAIQVAVNVFASGGANKGRIGGATAISVPSGGFAMFNRSGWHIYTASGQPVERVQVRGMVSAPSDVTVVGGVAIANWTQLQQGTYCTAAANGLTLNRGGNWFLEASQRASAGTANRYLGITIGGSMLLADYLVGGPGATQFSGHHASLVWACNPGNVANLNIWSDTASQGFSATTHLSAFYLGPFS